MKTKAFTLMLLAFCLTSMVSAQDNELKFFIVNQTGIDLYGVFVSETVKENWGEDIIPGDLFDDGSTVEVTIPIAYETMCDHDIQVTDYTGEARIFPEIDFCELTILTLFTGSDGEIYYKTE